MTAGEAIALTGAVFVLGFCFGCLFTLARKPVRPIVPIHRDPARYVQRGDVRETFDYDSRQIAEMHDRIAALKRENWTLRGLLSDKRLAEAHDARELRLVRGGE